MLINIPRLGVPMAALSQMRELQRDALCNSEKARRYRFKQCFAKNPFFRRNGNETARDHGSQNLTAVGESTDVALGL